MDAPKCRLCSERHWGGCVTKPIELVTKPTVTKPITLHDVMKRIGRPCIGDHAMTGAERVRRHRAKA